jgi:hypothetical protein
MKNYGGVEIYLLHSKTRHWMGVSGQFHTPAVIPPKVMLVSIE